MILLFTVTYIPTGSRLAAPPRFPHCTLSPPHIPMHGKKPASPEKDAPKYKEEPVRQYYFMAKCRRYVTELAKELGRKPTFFVQTFGCPKV